MKVTDIVCTGGDEKGFFSPFWKRSFEKPRGKCFIILVQKNFCLVFFLYRKYCMNGSEAEMAQNGFYCLNKS